MSSASSDVARCAPIRCGARSPSMGMNITLCFRHRSQHSNGYVHPRTRSPTTAAHRSQRRCWTTSSHHHRGSGPSRHPAPSTRNNNPSWARKAQPITQSAGWRTGKWRASGWGLAPRSRNSRSFCAPQYRVDLVSVMKKTCTFNNDQMVVHQNTRSTPLRLFARSLKTQTAFRSEKHSGAQKAAHEIEVSCPLRFRDFWRSKLTYDLDFQ